MLNFLLSYLSKPINSFTGGETTVLVKKKTILIDHKQASRLIKHRKFVKCVF